MIISRDHLKKYVQNFLSILNREKINSLSDLERNLNKTFNSEDSTHYISIELRSPLGIKVHTLSYIAPIVGVPIEVRLNQTLRYSLIIIKAGEKYSGYEPFALDPYGNIPQSKKIDSADFTKVRKELESLL